MYFWSKFRIFPNFGLTLPIAGKYGLKSPIKVTVRVECEMEIEPDLVVFYIELIDYNFD